MNKEKHVFDFEKDDQTLCSMVADRLPYDGPHSPDSVSDATGPGNGREALPYAPHTYRLIGTVHTTLSGFDQLVEQLGQALQRHADDSSLRHDDGQDPAETARQAAYALTEVRIKLNHLRNDVQLAWGLSSHLGHDLQEVDR